ncbi:MAG: HypC/HybG/HupF family hydrogenase formation chaperone, partial [Desulfurococcaceae archaeon]
MCIGTPAIILDVDYGNMTATVDYGDGVPRSVLIGISEEKVKRGDIVVVHAGVVVSRMSEDEILEQ